MYNCILFLVLYKKCILALSVPISTNYKPTCGLNGFLFPKKCTYSIGDGINYPVHMDEDTESLLGAENGMHGSNDGNGADTDNNTDGGLEFLTISSY